MILEVLGLMLLLATAVIESCPTWKCDPGTLSRVHLQCSGTRNLGASSQCKNVLKAPKSARTPLLRPPRDNTAAVGEALGQVGRAGLRGVPFWAFWITWYLQDL